MVIKDKIIHKYQDRIGKDNLQEFLEGQPYTSYSRLFLDENFFVSEFQKFGKSRDQSYQSSPILTKKSSSLRVDDSLFRSDTELSGEPSPNNQLNFRSSKPESQVVQTKPFELLPILRPAVPNGLRTDQSLHYFNCLTQMLFYTDKFSAEVLSLRFSQSVLGRPLAGSQISLEKTREFRFLISLQELFRSLQEREFRDVSAYYPFYYLPWRTDEPSLRPDPIGVAFERIIETVSLVRDAVVADNSLTKSEAPVRNGFHPDSFRTLPPYNPSRVTIGEVGRQQPPPVPPYQVDHLPNKRTVSASEAILKHFAHQFRLIIVSENAMTKTDQREPVYFIPVSVKSRSLTRALRHYFRVRMPDDEVESLPSNSKVPENPRFMEHSPQYLLFQIERDTSGPQMNEFGDEVKSRFFFDTRFWADEYLVENEFEITRIRRECLEQRSRVEEARQAIKLCHHYGKHKLDIFHVIKTMEVYCKEAGKPKLSDSFVSSKYFDGKLSSGRFAKACKDLTSKYNVQAAKYNQAEDFIQSAFSNFRKCQYSLYGVIMQAGPFGASHYYCYIRINGSWLCFNDSQVRTVSEDEVLGDGSGKKYVNSSACALFYEKYVYDM